MSNVNCKCNCHNAHNDTFKFRFDDYGKISLTDSQPINNEDLYQ